MKYILQILDIFTLSDDSIIISGVNPTFDELSNDNIEKYIGTKILIRNPDTTELIVDNVNVDIGISLIGKKNINIRLQKLLKLAEIHLNAIVFSID